MKALRLCLLLLLAVLLPIRGALALAAPCAGEGPSHRPMHSMAAVGAPASLHAHGGSHLHEHGDDAKCKLCASCCSGVPMPATFSPAIVPPEEAGASFPVLQASVATFLSDGQERPPRSI